jgi:hypothetical protein
MHVAAYFDQPAAVERLVNKGANVEAKDTVRSQRPLRPNGM